MDKQSLGKTSAPTEEAFRCAENVMETLHLMMRIIGRDVRKEYPPSLPEHQFRTLMVIKHHDRLSLSSVAERLGTTLPAVSKVVDQLVERGYVQRQTCLEDRRKSVLSLTEAGESVINAAKFQMHSKLAERLASLTEHECAVLDLAMSILHTALKSKSRGETDTCEDKK
ncbi:MAG: MarR family transcriptional regulator [Armatimonadota bacterium]|nr:MarR family transcriptional regulator [Armatimonadota bacterium]